MEVKSASAENDVTFTFRTDTEWIEVEIIKMISGVVPLVKLSRYYSAKAP